MSISPTQSPSTTTSSSSPHYPNSIPEFSTLSSFNVKVAIEESISGSSSYDYDEDPFVWEECSNALHALYVRMNGDKDLERAVEYAKRRADEGWAKLKKNLLEMEKPQTIYNFNTLSSPFPPSNPKPPPSSPLPSPPSFISAPQHLHSLVQTLSTTPQIFISIQSHSYRCFHPIICTLSIFPGDFLIDVLKLFHYRFLLKEFFETNQDVIKIVREKEMGLLEYWFGKMANVKVLKMVEMEGGEWRYWDWRMRELTKEMEECARWRGRRLMECFGKNVGGELTKPVGYRLKTFHAEGYLNIHPTATPPQKSLLAKLYSWRNSKARQLDESWSYIARDKVLKWIVEGDDEKWIHEVANDEIKTEILDFLNKATEESPPATNPNTKPISSPPNLTHLRDSLAFRPAEQPSSSIFSPLLHLSSNNKESSGFLSPVLDTATLYKQAGWLTPENSNVTQTTTQHQPKQKEPTQNQPEENEQHRPEEEEEHSSSSSSDNEPPSSNTIPKSMREIYQISNKNRKKNKISSSSSTSSVEEKEMDLQRANEILNQIHKGYFSGRAKRQQLPQQLLKEDRDLMVDIGWVESHQDLDQIQEELFRPNGDEMTEEEGVEDKRRGESPSKVQIQRRQGKPAQARTP